MSSIAPILIKGGLAVDDRGCLRFVNDFNFADVKRFYQVENFRQNFIRAWHGHKKEGKYVWVAHGSALVGVVPLEAQPGNPENVIKFILSAKSPAILHIPAGNYNGFKNLEENTQIIFFSTASIAETMDDDIRKPYDYWNIWSEDYR